jgi:hypothetical protein
VVKDTGENGEIMIPKPKKPKKVSDWVLDDLVRRYIRLISGGYCKRCKKYVGEENISTAHLFRRWRKTVRWDLRNVAPLCDNPPQGMMCHKIVDNDPIEMSSFIYEILSSDDIADLQRLANTTIREYPIDREQIKRELKEKIALLDGK